MLGRPQNTLGSSYLSLHSNDVVMYLWPCERDEAVPEAVATGADTVVLMLFDEDLGWGFVGRFSSIPVDGADLPIYYMYALGDWAIPSRKGQPMNIATDVDDSFLFAGNTIINEMDMYWWRCGAVTLCLCGQESIISTEKIT